MKVDGCNWTRQHTLLLQAVGLFLLWVSSIFFLINCPPLYNLVVLDGRVMEFGYLLFWVQRSGKITWRIPRAVIHLMLWTCVALSLAPFVTKASLRLPRIFSLYTYGASSSFSLFHPCWFLREKTRCLWFCQSVLYFHQFLRPHS